MGTKIDEFIEGTPYPKNKVKGDLEAPKRLGECITQCTQHRQKLYGSVSRTMKFILPENYSAKCHAYEKDLDNLLKRFQDALSTTVLSEADGKDGAIVKLIASKRPAQGSEPTGAKMILEEL